MLTRQVGFIIEASWFDFAPSVLILKGKQPSFLVLSSGEHLLRVFWFSYRSLKSKFIGELNLIFTIIMVYKQLSTNNYEIKECTLFGMEKFYTHRFKALYRDSRKL